VLGEDGSDESDDGILSTAADIVQENTGSACKDSEEQGKTAL